MKYVKNKRYYPGILALVIASVMLMVLSACDTGTAPSAVANQEEQTATLSITIPNIAPWLKQDAEKGAFTSKAWLTNDAVEFQLYDTDMNLVTWFVEEPGVTTYYDWAVPAGTYYLYTWVYNYNSNDWLIDGNASVFGAYPAQPDLLNPTNSFTVSPGESISVVVTNYPKVPVLIPNGTATAEYNEATDGEKWFTVNTNSTDTYLYVEVGGYSEDGTTDADMDLYLFGPDGLFITSSAAFSDGDPSTPDYETIDSSTDGFTVTPSATYYVGVYAYVGGNFDLYFESTP